MCATSCLSPPIRQNNKRFHSEHWSHQIRRICFISEWMESMLLTVIFVSVERGGAASTQFSDWGAARGTVVEIRRKKRLKSQISGPVWEYFGFKLNEQGESINTDEPVCRICVKVVVKKQKPNNKLAPFTESRVIRVSFPSWWKKCTWRSRDFSQHSTLAESFGRQSKYKQDSAKWCALRESVVRYIAKEILHINWGEKQVF